MMSALPSESPTLRDNSFDNNHSNQVDVLRAEETFNELSRQLSARSRRAWNESNGARKDRDLEKDGGESSQEEAFDLREYLSSSNDENQKAGIQHKHVGVTWEDLRVDVFGSIDHKVCLLVYHNIAPAQFSRRRFTSGLSAVGWIFRPVFTVLTPNRISRGCHRIFHIPHILVMVSDHTFAAFRKNPDPYSHHSAPVRHQRHPS